MTSATQHRSPLDHASFGGHETFPLRYAWLRKAVDHIGRDPGVFQRDDAMVTLGVGKNMVRAIRHWGLAAGVLEEDPSVPNNRGRSLRASALGSALFDADGWDPFFEDPATLWVIHHELASSAERATTWYWAFNHLPQPEFSKSDLAHWLTKLAQEHGWPRVSPASLKRDVDVFLRTYVAARTARGVALEDTLDCPLVELGLIREHGSKGNYLLQRGDQPTLPDAIFAYGLVRFLERREHASSAVPVHSIAFAAGSPGRVFSLTEDALMRRLEDLERTTDGAIVFHDTAGLRQLLVHRQPDALRILGTWYKRRNRRGNA